MDPETALETARETSERILNGEDEPDPRDVIKLAESFKALDDWIGGGGYLPDNWAHFHVRPNRR